MEWVEAGNRAAAVLKKYRWAAAVLLVGLVLMSLPEMKQPRQEPTATQQEHCSGEDLQTALETLLTQMDGAGKVKVLLSQASGGRTYYQTDENLSRRTDSSEHRTETVILSGSDRSQTPVVQRVDPPTYLGAVILCQGADSPKVRLAVVDAVATATGLTTDKISVWKMK